ncbi:MAG: hypothetical protein HYV02_08900 [Deltaproteobacteria bacterium]|nr:hypothetical protein [Deltaproteobacteria bacterium]
MKRMMITVVGLFILAATGYAANSPSGIPAKAAVHQHVIYHCSMHEESLSAVPAKCPKCGMQMTELTGFDIRYRCPMHGEVMAESPGRCPKCNMALEAQKERVRGSQDK